MAMLLRINPRILIEENEIRKREGANMLLAGTPFETGSRLLQDSLTANETDMERLFGFLTYHATDRYW